jgi:transcriptional regulator with XRE-family HTH domain
MSKQVSPIDLYIINKVKEMRIEKGYAQKELAFMLDISIGFMGDIESNKSKAKYSLDQINRLAIIFKCSPRDFLPENPFQIAES